MSERPLSLADVLWEECGHIARRRNLPSPGPKPEPDKDEPNKIFQQLPDQDRWALCLSGGGIRSATFALGVLQGLAQCGLLTRFDYLSTVSGGGYVGGWLTGWIQRHTEGLEGVVRGLVWPLQGKADPGPIRHLREHSNYLTPKLGALSADTWTLISTYARNLILHWLVLLPPMLIVLLTPKIGLQLLLADGPALPSLVGGIVALGGAMMLWLASGPAINPDDGRKLPWSPMRKLARGTAALLALFGLYLLARSCFWPWAEEVGTGRAIPARLAWGVLWAGTALLFGSMIFIDWNRPSARKRKDEQNTVLLLFLAPMMLSTILLALGWAWLQPKQPPSLWMLIGLGIGLRLLSWWIPRVLPPYGGLRAAGARPLDRGDYLARFLSAIATGALGGILVWLAARAALGDDLTRPTFIDRPELYACLAPPLLLGIFMLSEVLFIGMASFWTEDEDREWWGRSGAWLMIGVICWGGLRLISLYGPPLLVDNYANLSAAFAAGGLSGLATAVLGYGDKTEPIKAAIAKIKGPSSKRDMTLAVVAPLFIVVLLALLSLGMDVVLSDRRLHEDFHTQLIVSREYIGLGTLLAAILGLMVLAVVTSYCVNINKFSLHAMYRYRLIRAYLGASHRDRKPHPFTGFDPDDNIPMHDIWPNPRAEDLRPRKRRAGVERPVTGGNPQPLHVINIALNLVSGKKLAWQQRKADSFTVTPLHCGSRELGYRRAESYGGTGEGISLGTAVTISGAAASPNMGYHSSPVVTFIMSLFNVRLGWWLGNPGKKGSKTYKESGPEFAVTPLMAETFGLTNSENPYVYLSDGGHFENLGLYEMVLRRCSLIVVSDAGCDPRCEFEDLGNAIRKIRIDLGVNIEFGEDFAVNKLPMRPRDERSPFALDDGSGRYCAVGGIHYPDGMPPGVLIYLKPGLGGGEPADVLNYAAKNSFFPHEPTGDQWFSESQFESYRALGLHVAETVFGREPLAPDVHDLEARARRRAYPSSEDRKAAAPAPAPGKSA